MQNLASEEEYVVQKILAKKEYPTPKYLVKWEGYDIKESTWEPLENLFNAMDLVDDFEKSEAIIKNEKELKKQKEYLLSQKTNRKNIFDENDNHSNHSNNNDKKNYQENNYWDHPENKYLNRSKSKQSKQNNLNKVNKIKDKINKANDSNKDKVSNSFPKNEEVEAIKTVKLINNEIHCLISFKAKSSGLKMEDTFISSTVLADNIPILLIEFYESKIKFI